MSNFFITIDEKTIQDIMDLCQFIGLQSKIDGLNNHDGYGQRLAMLKNLMNKHNGKYTLAENLFYKIQKLYKEKYDER